MNPFRQTLAEDLNLYKCFIWRFSESSATLKQNDWICVLKHGRGFDVAHLVSPTQIRIMFQAFGHVIWLVVFESSTNTK